MMSHNHDSTTGTVQKTLLFIIKNFIVICFKYQCQHFSMLFYSQDYVVNMLNTQVVRNLFICCRPSYTSLFRIIQNNHSHYKHFSTEHHITANLGFLPSLGFDVAQDEKEQSKDVNVAVNGNARSEEKCDRCKDKEKSAVCYCLTCEKRLCPHHEKVGPTRSA